MSPRRIALAVLVVFTAAATPALAEEDPPAEPATTTAATTTAVPAAPTVVPMPTDPWTRQCTFSSGYPVSYKIKDGTLDLVVELGDGYVFENGEQVAYVTVPIAGADCTSKTDPAPTDAAPPGP